MTFKYFENPEIFVGLKDNETICDTCGEMKKCFDAESFFGEDKINSICPDCLANGQLKNKSIFTCDGDISELKRQLKEIHPSYSDIEINSLAIEMTNELVKTTPHLVTWQDWPWPCADGDYCTFIGYGSKPFFNALSTVNTGEYIFKNSLYNSLIDNSDVDYLWNNVLSQDEVKDYNDSNKLTTLFYVFKSKISDKIITVLDCY